MFLTLRVWGAVTFAFIECVSTYADDAPAAPYRETGGPYSFAPGLRILVTGTGNGRVTARCDNPAYQSSIGAISCDGDGGTCLADAPADAGTTTVTLTAIPDPGSVLVAWSGPCVATTGDPETATLTMDGQASLICEVQFKGTGCNNPYVIETSFDTDADWEWQEFGTGITGSTQPTGGNPGAFRLGGLDRFPGLLASFVLHALHEGTYDPATQGQVTGFLYEEDRILVTQPQPREGIRSGLYIRDPTYAYEGFIEPPDTYFAETVWTKKSVRVELTDIVMKVNVPFRVGYVREVFVDKGTGTLEHGIDNVRISICR